ncbi:MAG: hypothetical protein QM775_00870 [Pirellulales bacterium]
MIRLLQRSSTVLLLAVAGCFLGCEKAEPPIVLPPPSAEEAQLPEPAAIASLEPGTVIDPKSPPAGSSLVFRSQPKLTTGDVKKVGNSIRSALEEYTTLVVIRSEPDPSAPGRFRRRDHLLGIGKPGEAGDKVVTVESASKLGVGLGMFEKRVLGEREKELATVKSPGATPTMAMFDFTMLLLRDDKPTPVVARYMAVVDPADGSFRTAYWVLDVTPQGYAFHGDSLFELARNHVMDWEMHVNGKHVTFGAPSAKALTSTKLAEGKPLAVSADFKKAASARSFNADTAGKLEQQVRALLK